MASATSSLVPSLPAGERINPGVSGEVGLNGLRLDTGAAHLLDHLSGAGAERIKVHQRDAIQIRTATAGGEAERAKQPPPAAAFKSGLRDARLPDR